MAHYEIAQWVDYVRGVGSDSADMTQHLTSGCTDCKATARRLAIFARFTADDGQYDPPAEIVRAAHALFALRQPERITFPELVARLIYDSFKDPLPVGMRGVPAVGRHILYEAGPYAVDLRLDRERDTQRVALTGQVASRDVSVPLQRLRICLTRNERVVAETTTNVTNEFQLEYEPQAQLVLRIEIDSDRQIDVPLVKLEDTTTRKRDAS